MITNKFAKGDATVASGVCNVCEIMFVKLCTWNCVFVYLVQ